MWQTVEASVGKIGMGETERRGSKERSRKEEEREGQEEKTEKGKTMEVKKVVEEWEI